MKIRFKKLKKNDFKRVYGLYPKQPWLSEKENSLIELFEICETDEHKDLIVDLLSEFRYPNYQELNGYLNFISEKIIYQTGFKQESTQIASITIDDEADSSQKVLDYIKIPLFKMGWSTVKTVNRFNNIPKNFKKGKTQIILIDEFIGSGKTVLGRIKNIKEWLESDFELKFCFLVGMENGIKIIEELGYEVYCPLRLPKGISERFSEDVAFEAIRKMKEIESKLATEISDHKLETYSLGYNNAQALYSLESCLGNTPNSVFPVFWWPRNFSNFSRNTLLTRVENGLK